MWEGLVRGKPGKEQEEKENGEIGQKRPAPGLNRSKKGAGPLVSSSEGLSRQGTLESGVRRRKGGAPSQSRGRRSSTESSANWGSP